jgi:hypothetical protein
VPPAEASLAAASGADLPPVFGGALPSGPFPPVAAVEASAEPSGSFLEDDSSSEQAAAIAESPSTQSQIDRIDHKRNSGSVAIELAPAYGRSP